MVSKPEWRQNQFGGSIGGPIVKDKTFFFGDVEDDRIVQGISTGDVTVPTCYEEANPGDFTDVGGPYVPPTALDPVGLAYFKMFPKPNLSCTSPTGNYINIGKEPQTTLSLDGRIDQHFSNGDTLFGRYSYNNVNTFVPGAFPSVTDNNTVIQPGGNMFAWSGNSVTKAHGFQLSYDHPFNQDLMTELKAGYTRVYIATLNLNHGTNASDAIGLINANTPAAPETSGLMPLFFLQGGYSFLGDTIAIPIINYNDNYLYSAAMLYTHGAHNIKIGSQITRRQLNYFNQNYPMGLVFFAGLTGNSLEDLLTGLPLGWERTDTLYKNGYRSWELGWYAQDNWRVSNKLTLNLGLRYDLYTPLTEVHGRNANFIFPTQTLLLGTADPDAGVRTNHLNLAPVSGFRTPPYPRLWYAAVTASATTRLRLCPMRCL